LPAATVANGGLRPRAIGRALADFVPEHGWQGKCAIDRSSTRWVSASLSSQLHKAPARGYVPLPLRAQLMGLASIWSCASRIAGPTCGRLARSSTPQP